MKTLSKILGTIVLGGVFFNGFSLAQIEEESPPRPVTSPVDPPMSDPVAPRGPTNPTDPPMSDPVAPRGPTNPTDSAPKPSDNRKKDLISAVYSNANAVGKEGEEVLAGEQNVFVRVGRFLLQLAVLLSVTVMIYGGVMYAGSQGDEAKAKKSISIILYAVYGLILALASLLIVNLIQSGVKTTTQLSKG